MNITSQIKQPIFNEMEGNPHNLWPEVGEINQLRSNYSFAELRQSDYDFGGCAVKLQDRKFMPEEQEFKCMMAHEAFAPVQGGWGRQGWTTATLSGLSVPELTDALETGWRHALPKKGKRSGR